jgi:hypothetical protein
MLMAIKKNIKIAIIKSWKTLRNQGSEVTLFAESNIRSIRNEKNLNLPSLKFEVTLEIGLRFD